MITYGSLFSGIGGIDLGFDRAGMICQWQVECDPFAVRVLEKHWPSVPRYLDVTEFNPTESVDVVCGGFPCQDISNAANNRKGLNGKRSGLWGEMLRVVERIRPSFIFIENVSALRRMGLGVVLRELSAIGYDAEWQTLRASHFGYPHKRTRLFIVAYSNSIEWCARGNHGTQVSVDHRHQRTAAAFQCESGWDLQRWFIETLGTLGFPPADPATRGNADGIPNRMDRLRCVGNAVVPDIAERIGRRIVQIIESTLPVE